MVIGGVTLFGILPAYEIFVKKRGKEPYLPLHLFKNIRFQAAAWNTGIAAGVYYGFGIVFPQLVVTVYYGRGQISEYEIGTLAGLCPMAFVFAQMVHGPIVWFTGPRWAMIGAAIIGAVLLTCASIDLNNLALTKGLVITGAFAMGIVEGVSITTSTFPLRSQEEIGQGGGLSGSTRNFVSAIAVAIYTATLGNRLLQSIPSRVYPVARELGLPEGSLANLALALQGKGSYNVVSGLTLLSEKPSRNRTGLHSSMLPERCSLYLWPSPALPLSWLASRLRMMNVPQTMSPEVFTLRGSRRTSSRKNAPQTKGRQNLS